MSQGRPSGPLRLSNLHDRWSGQIHERKVTGMLAASGYPFLDIMWTMFIFFAWVIWIWLLILVLSDNFRRRDHSGWA
jgi:hypothetical protein